MKKEYYYLIGGFLALGTVVYLYGKSQKETISSAAGHEPRQRLFESWEHYKGRLMAWYKENN